MILLRTLNRSTQLDKHPCPSQSEAGFQVDNHYPASTWLFPGGPIPARFVQKQKQYGSLGFGWTYPTDSSFLGRELWPNFTGTTRLSSKSHNVTQKVLGSAAILKPVSSEDGRRMLVLTRRSAKVSSGRWSWSLLTVSCLVSRDFHRQKRSPM
jgi:hypothetical protein